MQVRAEEAERERDEAQSDAQDRAEARRRGYVSALHDAADAVNGKAYGDAVAAIQALPGYR
jgi:hypothetical protein